MKPYSGRLRTARRDVLTPKEPLRFRGLPERLLQISAIATAFWSITAYTFGIGFVTRIDASILQVITVADVFGVSISYAIYLIPIAVLFALWPWQFMLPMPVNKIDQEFTVELLPVIFYNFIRKNKFTITIVIVIIINMLWLISTNRRWIDESSMVYLMGDTIILPLTMFGAILIMPGFSVVFRIHKMSFYLAFAGCLTISFSYLLGDYLASIRMNNPSLLDCAVLQDDNKRCVPILVWGSAYFISYDKKDIRAIPTSKVEYIWLHPKRKTN